MEFDHYQKKAGETYQLPTREGDDGIVPFLGIIGEVGSVVTELKRLLRDGDSYVGYKENLKEELGDVLWYIATIATNAELTLEEIAKRNLEKTRDRFLVPADHEVVDFDFGFPEQERFPEELVLEFRPLDHDPNKVEIVNYLTGERIGNELSDNSHDQDGYRFHDVFHYGNMAILGWSPVLRSLLKRKRKSKPEIDENEDGARGAITEELVALYINHHAQEHSLFAYQKSVDSGVIRQVQVLVGKTEAKAIRGKQWERVILDSYEVFRLLIENEGGFVRVSRKERRIQFLGKQIDQSGLANVEAVA